jgi:hypothetical protein
MVYRAQHARTHVTVGNKQTPARAICRHSSYTHTQHASGIPASCLCRRARSRGALLKVALIPKVRSSLIKIHSFRWSGIALQAECGTARCPRLRRPATPARGGAAVALARPRTHETQTPSRPWPCPRKWPTNPWHDRDSNNNILPHAAPPPVLCRRPIRSQYFLCSPRKLRCACAARRNGQPLRFQERCLQRGRRAPAAIRTRPQELPPLCSNLCRQPGLASADLKSRFKMPHVTLRLAARTHVNTPTSPSLHESGSCQEVCTPDVQSRAMQATNPLPTLLAWGHALLSKTALKSDALSPGSVVSEAFLTMLGRRE